MLEFLTIAFMDKENKKGGKIDEAARFINIKYTTH